MTKTSICSICGKPAERRPQNKSHPFCSERCRMLDLGNWLNESYRISGSRLGDDELAERAAAGGGEAASASGDGEPES